MKREDIAKLFEGATDEQISALFDINSQDIGKAKRGSEKLQADLDAANDALKKGAGNHRRAGRRTRPTYRRCNSRSTLTNRPRPSAPRR